MIEPRSLSYKDAGVDIDAGNELVRRIGPAVASTRRPGVVSGLGGFGGLFELPEGLQRPVLVSGTDGVGTKLRLAIDSGRHDTVGIDLVAMCVNDVLVQGAEPLFFLDYYATGRLDVDTAASVVEGIAEGCRQSGMALIGGETAELPGMYEGDDYDLAGFCVGVVERERIIDGSRVADGDAVVGLASSGPHSNGYSLIRKVLDVTGTDPLSDFEGRPLIDTLMAPTRIYVRAVLDLLARMDVSAIAHITGGGLPENLPRVLPDGLEAVIHRSSWTRPPVFDWLASAGNIPDDELYRTFNCGLGLAIVLRPDDAAAAVDHLTAAGETAWIAGHVRAGSGGTVLA